MRLQSTQFAFAMRAKVVSGMGSLRFCFVLLLALVMLVPIAVPARGAVMSIDLGSEWVKVAVVNLKAGQSPIAIAINEMSKRKSPALVAFSNGERLLAEEAAGIVARYPERVYSGVREMLAKPKQAVQAQLEANHLPYNVVADSRGRASIRIHDGSASYSSEDFVAMLLTYARHLAEAHSKAVVKDAVILVPPYFGQAERQSLLDAAQIAGISVLSLVNEHSGAALQYGIDKDFTDGSRDVVFYDMGANSVYAAVVHFSAYPGKDRGKNVTFQQFQVTGVRWDPSIGGQTMEMRLVDYFADEFRNQTGIDIRNNPKAMAKLKKQVKRTKHILSANTEAPLSVEALHEDVDFRSSITREKFEEVCGDLWERALVPLQQVLADTGITLSQLHAVELIGGATRVPKLQAVLGAYVGKQGLDRHLDADEAVSLGAALQAANLSDGFKLNRKIGMVDGSTYGIVIEMDGATLESEDQKLLVPRMKKLPSKLFRSLKNQKQDFNSTLKYDETDVLPPSSASPVIAKYEISGVAEAAAKYASHNLSAPIKTNLHFSLSRSGLVHLDKAETVVEISEWVDVPVLESNSTSLPSNDTSEVGGIGQQSSETASGDANVTSATENVKPTMKQKLRKRTIRIPLKINGVTEGRLTESSLATSALQLEKLNLQDAEKRQTAEAKNSLESYIYATKDKLESLEDLEKVSSEQQRDALHVELGEAEDWLYTDGEHATAAEFTMRLQALESSVKPIFFRLQELTSRPSAVQEARTYLEDIKQVLQGWETRKPWLSAKSINEIVVYLSTPHQLLMKSVAKWQLVTVIDDEGDGLILCRCTRVHTELKTVQGWLDTVELRQQKTPGDVEPAFTSDDVLARTEKIREQVTKLERLPKPKAEKPANTSNTDGGSSSDSSEKSTAEDEKLEEQHVEENGDSEQEEGVDQAGHDEL